MKEIELVQDIGNLRLTRREHAIVRLSKIRDFVFESGILILTAVSALIIVFIFIFILNKAWIVLKGSGAGFVYNTGFEKQVLEAFNAPAGEPVLKFGVLGLITGTLLTTILALVIAIPVGLGTSIVISELAPRWIKNPIMSVIKLLASIPSIIFGLIGLLVVVPFITKYMVSPEIQIKYIQLFQITGKGMLAGVVVLSIMIMPIIIALSVDSINAVPKKYKEASLALGISHWRSIVKVIVPAAKSGILAGIILATGRAVGEAIALSVVTGGIPYIPKPSNGYVFFLTPVLSLASAIVNKSETLAVPSIESALFACGVILLLTNTLLSLSTKIVEYIVKRRIGLE